MSVKKPGWLASCFWGLFITPIVLLAGNLLISILPVSMSQQMEQMINDHMVLILGIAYSASIFIFRHLDINPLEEKDWL